MIEVIFIDIKTNQEVVQVSPYLDKEGKVLVKRIKDGVKYRVNPDELKMSGRTIKWKSN